MCWMRRGCFFAAVVATALAIAERAFAAEAATQIAKPVPAAPAAPLDADGLLEKLKAMDALCEAGFTAAGTYVNALSNYRDVPPRKMKWKIAVSGEKMALEEEVIEVLRWKDVLGPDEEPPAPYSETGRFFILYRHKEHVPPAYPGPGGLLLVLRQTYFVCPEYQASCDWLGTARPSGPLPPWPQNEPGLASSGNVTVEGRDKDAYVGKVIHRMQYLGRWYSRNIDRVVSVSPEKDGLISFTAEGSRGWLGPLKWKCVVDPNAAYMMRFVALDYTKIPEWHEERTFRGLQWSGSVCVPERMEMRGAKYPHKVTFVSSKVDPEVLRTAEKTVRGPYLVSTRLIDARSTEPRVYEYKRGESWKDEQ